MIIFILTAIAILITYIFGLLYAVSSSANRRCLIKAIGWSGFSVLGLIGVPFHEITHLITALIFNHNITDVALYRPIKGRQDGRLGYVHHEYNPHSLYQKIGNFFIGVAPMLGGAAVLTVLLQQVVPRHKTVITSISYKFICDTVINIIMRYIDSLQCGNMYAYALLIIAILICPHMSMSFADFKNSLCGSIFVLAASIIVPYIVFTNLGISYDTMSVVLFDVLIKYAYVLIIGLIINVIVLGINKALSIIF